MFYLGPVFRLVGRRRACMLFVPTIYGSYMFSNMSFAGDLILALYFVFFGTLGMALGAGRKRPSLCGHRRLARALAGYHRGELPLALAVFAVALQYQTLSI